METKNLTAVFMTMLVIASIVISPIMAAESQNVARKILVTTPVADAGVTAGPGGQATITDSGSQTTVDPTSDISPEPVEIKPAILRVKAYDAQTNEPIKGAITIVVRILSSGVVGGTGETTSSGSGVTTESAVASTGTGYVTGDESAETSPESGTGSTGAGPGPIIARYEIVVGTLNANGEDTFPMKPGIYKLITYAKGYAIYTLYYLKVGAGNEYNLYAPMSRGYIKPVPSPEPGIGVAPGIPSEAETVAVPIVIIDRTDGGEVVSIVPSITKKQVEIAPVAAGQGSAGEVSISPATEVPGKYVIESEAVEAVTDADIEIDGDKLYIKNNETKTQVKILPSTASEIAQEALLSHRIKNIILEIVDKKPVYTVDAEEDANLLGFIPTIVPLKAKVNAETGAVSGIEKPWWAFLAIRSG